MQVLRGLSVQLSTMHISEVSKNECVCNEANIADTVVSVLSAIIK